MPPELLAEAQRQRDRGKAIHQALHGGVFDVDTMMQASDAALWAADPEFARSLGITEPRAQSLKIPHDPGAWIRK